MNEADLTQFKAFLAQSNSSSLELESLVYIVWLCFAHKLQKVKNLSDTDIKALLEELKKESFPPDFFLTQIQSDSLSGSHSGV